MAYYQLYRCLVYLLIPLLLIVQWRKGFRNKGYWKHWGERFGFGDKPNSNIDIWVHAVSVGETRAIAALIKRILSEKPDTKILLTMSTPTGRETAETLFKGLMNDSVYIRYLPYDIGFCTRRFLKTIKPKLGLIVETEVWPNLIVHAEKQQIPLIYTNVRLSERSFNKYQKWSKFSQAIFKKIHHFAIQSPADAARVSKLGVPLSKISITGNIKFDMNLPASLKETAQGFRSMVAGQRTILIAGSTRDHEEEKVLPVFRRLQERHPDLLLILVPRHPERADIVAKLCKPNKLKYVRRSKRKSEVASDVDVYIGDTLGDLSLLYAASDIAFVGGSLVEFGGQNILEPCALGVPVIFGPHMYNFEEISALTLEADAGIQVLDEEQLEAAFEALITDPNRRDEIGVNGKQLIDTHKGALDRIYAVIKPYL